MSTRSAGIFETSPNTRHALDSTRPRTRGLSHRIAAFVAVPAAIWLTVTAPPGPARVGAGLFGLGIAVMFTASAVVHLRRWPPPVAEVLYRLDHTGIFLAIAGTATPIALLALDGWQRAYLLWSVWGGSAIGLAVVWWPRPTPRGFGNTVFITLGGLTVPVLPWIVRSAGWDTVGLMVAGGALYVLGAVIVGLRRPDPAPEVFGYHEIWHLLVIAAVVLHYVMVAGTLLPLAERGV